MRGLGRTVHRKWCKFCFYHKWGPPITFNKLVHLYRHIRKHHRDDWEMDGGDIYAEGSFYCKARYATD